MTGQAPSPGGSSVAQNTTNLIKNIMGFAVLTLPAGIERLSDMGLASSEALSLGLALLVVFGVINAWTFYLIGEACEKTGTSSYADAWHQTIGARWAWLVTAASIFISFTTAVGCQAIISVTFTDLVSFGSGVAYDDLPRRSMQLLITLFVLLPLCRLPSLQPLAAASFFGVLGTSATALCLVVRLLDASYATGGDLFEVVQYTPTFSQAAEETRLLERLPSTGSIAFFLSLTSNAYLAHANAPLIYSESRADAGGRKLGPFRRATLLAFAASAALCLCIGGAGFATFGEAVQPIILANYASADPLAALARFGIFLTVLFECPPRVGLITAVSLYDPPLDKLTAFGGATGGALLIYVAPALIALRLHDADARAEADAKTGAQAGADAARAAARVDARAAAEAPQQRGRPPGADATRLALLGLVALGTALGVVGTYGALTERPDDANPPMAASLSGEPSARAPSAPMAPIVYALVCALPARLLPARVGDVWSGADASNRGAIYLG